MIPLTLCVQLDPQAPVIAHPGIFTALAFDHPWCCNPVLATICTLRLLNQVGCDVSAPAEQGCCGVLYSQGGWLEQARECARHNIAVFERQQLDYIVINASGCGSTLKDYGHLLKDDPEWADCASAFAAKVRDSVEVMVLPGCSLPPFSPSQAELLFDPTRWRLLISRPVQPLRGTRMPVPEIPERFNAAAALVDAHITAGRGHKPAILCGDQTITYQQLYENVNRVGNLLLKLGVRMEERVATLLPDCPEVFYAFLGAMKIGAVSIPLNTMLVAKEYQHLLNDCRAHVLVVAPSLLHHVMEIREHLNYLKHIVVAGPDPEGPLILSELMAAASPKLEPANTSKDDSAFWLYSTGTSGGSKAAIHLHHDMIFAADLYARDTIGLRESDVSFSSAKTFFAYGLGNGLYFPLRLGGTTVLLSDRSLPEAIFKTIDRHQPTVFYSVPTSYAKMLHYAKKTGRKELGRVRMCVSAGELLPSDLYEKWLDRFGVEIVDGIGSTEVLHIYISNRPGHVRPGSTGQIVPGFEARIVDDHGNDVPVGQTGTLHVKGDSIAAGYRNQHELTKATFLGEWINTKDQFYVDADGFFWYAGRIDDMFKVSGMMVFPSDIEGVLQHHPAVLESGVIGVPDEDELTKVRAYVVLKDHYQPSQELVRELQLFVKTNTMPHKYPRSIIFVKELPKSATGQIQRYKLRELAAQRAM